MEELPARKPNIETIDAKDKAIDEYIFFVNISFQPRKRKSSLLRQSNLGLSETNGGVLNFHFLAVWIICIVFEFRSNLKCCSDWFVPPNCDIN